VWRRWRSNKGCDRIRTEYKIASDAYTDAVREFHRDREVNILSSRNSSTFHKFIRRQLKRTEIIPTLIDANNVQIDDCDAKANLFNDFFCSTFTHDNNILPPFPSRVTAGSTLLDNILFTPASVSTKLKGLTKSTTLNPDNFPPIVLQSCAHQLGLPLSIIFNTIFERSELPPAWLTSTVLPLFKKGERNQASNYRPISITSSCCKVMESIIHDSMSSYLLSNNLISDSQHGFLKKRSTLSNLIYSIRHWLSSLNSGKSTDVIYVDFAKAFDSVSHSKLLHKLISYGFSGKLHAWISTWLSGRTQTVKLGSSFSSPKSVLSGILQGSVLGPLLFLIYINDLIDLLSPDCHPTLFADDLKLFSDTSPVFIPGSDSLVASRLLQSSLDHLLLWSSLWQLPISIPKCSVLSISNSKLLRTRHYLIGNHPLPQVSNCSDLGVIIDSQLSFSHHILATTKKASRQSALILRCFLSRDALNLKLAFYAYVRPILEYASPIWSPHTQKGIDLLENVQRRFTKSISKLHYLPYTARLSSLNIPTLSCRRTHIDLCTVYRILHYHTCLDPSCYFSFRTESVTRGHPFTLLKPPVRLDSSKFSLFSRIIDLWNSLPFTVVSAGSFSAFKARLKLLLF
jgi:hypothetical protein